MKDDNSRNKKKRSKNLIRKCVECDSAEFYKDEKLKEISCLKCGLVLYAPPTADFITDGFKFEDADKSNKK